MGFSDDEYVDDDVYYEDDEDVNDLYDEDDEEVDSRSSVNPFSSGGSRSPYNRSSGSSGLPGGGRSSSNFSSGGSSFGGRSSSSPTSRDRSSSSSSSNRYGGSSSGSSGSNRFGGSSSSGDRSKTGPLSSSGSSGSGSNRFGGSSSSGGRSKTGPLSSSGSSGSGSNRFGSSSSSGGRSKTGPLSGDKDDKSSGGSSNRFGSNRFGRGGGDDKKDDKKPAAKKDDKGGDGGGIAGRLGGLSSRLPFGGGGSDDKKDDKKPAAKKDDKGGDGGGIAGRLGGLSSRLPFGGGGSDDKKDAKKPAASKPGDRGGAAAGSSRFGTNRFGRGGGDKAGGDKAGGDNKAASGSKRSPFGNRAASDRKSPPTASKATASSADAKADSGGGLLSGLTSRLPFGGGGDDKKKPKTSKTRASKVPKASDGGFELDLDAKLDLLGVVLVFAGIILFISSLSADQGALTGGINGFFTDLFGWGSIAAPVGMFAVGVWLIVRHFGDEPPEIDPIRLIGLSMIFLGILMFMTFIETFSDLYTAVTSREVLILFLDTSVAAGRGGGQIGTELYIVLINNVGEFGAVFAIMGWTVVGIMFATRTSAAELAVFVISIYRSFQIAVQHRAQRRRAERMAQLEAQQSASPAQINVSKPASAELTSGAASGALPAPEAQQNGPLPIEERPIPIRMGGQMVTANSPDAEDDTSGEPAAIAQAAQPVEDDASGLFGGIAARLRKATPSLPFGSSDDDKNGTDGTEKAPAAAKTDDTSDGTAAAAALGTAAALGGLFGRGASGDDEKEAIPAKPPVPPMPNRTTPATGAPGTGSSPFQRPTATSADAVGQPKPDNVTQFPGSSQPAASLPTAAPPRPKPGLDADDLVKGTASASSDEPVTPAATPRPTGSLQDRLAAMRARPGASVTTDAPTTEDATTSNGQSTDAADKPATSGRMSRLEQIRAGQINRPGMPNQPVGTTTNGDHTDADETDADDESVATTAMPSMDALWGAADKATPAKTDDATPAAAKPSATDESNKRGFTLPTARAGSLPKQPEKTDAPEPVRNIPKAGEAPTASGAHTPSAQPPAAATPQRSEPVINRPKPEPQPQPAKPKGQTEWRLPDYRTLLSTGSEGEFDRDALVRKARIIEETLQSFGAPGRVVEINTGPVITQFGVEPDYLTSRSGKKSRVKVSAMAALDKDLQLALGAKSIRVEAPVPGKGFVGIEVPNDEASLVSLRDVMESRAFTRIKSPLGFGLGQSVDGSPIAGDLTSMPHLLIAGTTGSGKSVCVNAIICSMLVHNSPDMVKFIMVDPKRVELTGYNGIPHLVAPVVVELERIVGVLKWVTREMDERYKKFSNIGARNIVDYNNIRPEGSEPMPYIVVIIDELADLMMLAPDETERVITRIAALARATGIHLVIATQRPSVDVVTGLIKANFPARIAFAVAGGVDSRVILDQPGAERLLGKGDMLYLSGDSPAALRLQGVYVSDMEINNIVRFWKSQGANMAQQKPITALVMDDSPAPESRSVIPRGERFTQPPPASASSPQRAFWEETSPDNPENHSAGYGISEREQNEDRDELYGEAVELVRRLNKASVSLLQRRLRIGYTRAARLIDIMEAESIVGPPTEGSKPREVLPHKK